MYDGSIRIVTHKSIAAHVSSISLLCKRVCIIITGRLPWGRPRFGFVETMAGATPDFFKNHAIW
jgi:hypothetical protein